MEIFEISLETLGVTQLYLNQRKLAAVKDKIQQEDFAGFAPLPVSDFGDGVTALTDGHHRAFAAWQMGKKSTEVYWDKDPNTVGKLSQRLYRMERKWCQQTGIQKIADLESRILQPPAYEFFWLERCRRGYNLITTRNQKALERAKTLAPELTLYGTERDLRTFYFEDDQNRLFKYYDGELLPERGDNF